MPGSNTLQCNHRRNEVSISRPLPPWGKREISLAVSIEDRRSSKSGSVSSMRSRELRTSDAFLAIFEKHLGSEWDVDDDASMELTDPEGIKRRKLEESDEEVNIHIRRRGRMPPKPKSSSNWRSSQTTGSSAFCSTVSSSDPDSFMSTGSRNDGPPEKQ